MTAGQRDPSAFLAAREQLDAAVRAYAQAGDELDLADAERLGDLEKVDEVRLRMTSHVTHWALVFSRTRWERDPEDPGDPEERPATTVQVGTQDSSVSGWVVAGLLRRALLIIDESH